VVGKILYLRQTDHFGPARSPCISSATTTWRCPPSGLWGILKRLELNRLPASQGYKRLDKRYLRYEKQRPGPQIAANLLRIWASTRSLNVAVRAAAGIRHLRWRLLWPGIGAPMYRCAAAGIAAVFLFTAVAAFDPASSPLAHAAGADAAVRVVRFTGADAALSVQFVGYAGGGRMASVPAGTAPAAGGYAPLPSGLYVVTVRSGLPVSSVLTLRAQPGAAYTVAVLIHARTVQVRLIHDDLTAPPPGFGRVRLALAAVGVSRAHVALASGPVLADAAPFGTVTGYHTLRAGSWQMSVAAATNAGKGLPRLTGPRITADVAVASGSLTTLVVVKTPSGSMAVHAITDAAGARHSPGGPVPAGGGGMAAELAGHQGGPSAAVMGVLELFGAFALWAGLHALVAALRRRPATRQSDR
jgi:hypothetical protein